MICFAKGVSNGAVPLSGVMVRAGVHDGLMSGPDAQTPQGIELFHGHTYSGHPLSVAAGLATLDLYRDEGLFERARAMEASFAEIMMSLRGAPHVADIRPIGLMCGIDLAPAEGKPGAKGYAMIEETFHAQDLYVRVAGDTMIVAPSLIASDGDISAIRDRVSKALCAL